MAGKVAAHEGGGLDKIEPFWISRTKTIRHGLDGGRGNPVGCRPSVSTEIVGREIDGGHARNRPTLWQLGRPQAYSLPCG